MDPARLIFEDELTGISNRRFLYNYLKHKVRWADRDECVLSLIMTDLDGFKQLNDRFGHQFGDRALIWFAEQLKQVAGDEGLPVRNSGDEFMILMPGCTKSQARRMAERLLQRFRDEPFSSREGELNLCLSIGVASAPEDARDAENLIRQADVALYCAKNAGGNRIWRSSPSRPSNRLMVSRLSDAEPSSSGQPMDSTGSLFARARFSWLRVQPGWARAPSSRPSAASSARTRWGRWSRCGAARRSSSAHTT
jgi:diguanylate cyclase (GGDEF)-like protein